MWNAAVAALGTALTVAALGVPATVVIDGGRLDAARAQVFAGSACSPFATALANLKADADKWLSKGPWSVIDKGKAAPGGTINDYYSMAPYFWPTVEPTTDNVSRPRR